MAEESTMTGLTKRVIDASVTHAAGASKAIAKGFSAFGDQFDRLRDDPARGFIEGMIQGWGVAINKYAETLDKVSKVLNPEGSSGGKDPKTGEPQEKETAFTRRST